SFPAKSNWTNPKSLATARFSPLSPGGADSVAGPGGEAAVVGRRFGVLRGADRHVRVFDLAEAVDQALPLVRFQQRRELRFGAAFDRVVADVDMVVVVGQREARFPGQVLE